MAKQVNIIMGGPSAEHEVSLNTGREMLKHLDKTKYRIRPVVITMGKKLYYSDADAAALTEADFSGPDTSSHFKGPVSAAGSQEIWDGCDIALLALHGEFGEDGKIQGFLETLDIPYTGSGVCASAVGMDKIQSKYLFEQQGITTPPYSIYRTDGSGITIDEIGAKHGFPCYVKCPQSGSSRLMDRADSRESLEKIVAELSKESDEFLIESNISGDEYSSPILEYPDGSLKQLPPILIRPVASAYFDYTAKYTAGASEEITPAPCSEDLTKRLQEVSLKAHLALKCQGLSRTDMIVKDDIIYTLETNTLPGLTSASLVPKSFAAAGGTYTELLDIIIETALAGRKK